MIWLAKMMTAMPAVKPTVTGNGMYLMKVPSLSKPIAAMSMPRQQRGKDQAVEAVRATVAETSTMNAPAGPPIWKRLPPSAETRKPPMIEA